MSKDWLKVGDRIEYDSKAEVLTFENAYSRYEEQERKNDFKILLVDDEVELLDTYKELLEEIGFTSVTAYTGAIEAIDTLDNYEYDLIISDFRMPEMNGYGLYTHIKRMLKPPVFIMITAFCTSEIEALNHVGVLTINKPFNPIGLQNVVLSFYIKKLNEERVT